MLLVCTSLIRVTCVWLPTVLLNSPQIFEKIFGDELIMDIIGALECKFHLHLFMLTSRIRMEFKCLRYFFGLFGDYEANKHSLYKMLGQSWGLNILLAFIILA